MKKTLLIVILLIGLFSCKKNNSLLTTQKQIEIPNVKNPTKIEEIKEEIKITFIQLGSNKCMPCVMMKPILKKVEEKYNDKVKVIYYDIWTEKDAPMAYKYKIRVIPTQIFLDKDGNEYFRHEGYLPFEEIQRVLGMQGVY